MCLTKIQTKCFYTEKWWQVVCNFNIFAKGVKRIKLCIITSLALLSFEKWKLHLAIVFNIILALLLLGNLSKFIFLQTHSDISTHPLVFFSEACLLFKKFKRYNNQQFNKHANFSIIFAVFPWRNFVWKISCNAALIHFPILFNSMKPSYKYHSLDTGGFIKTVPFVINLISVHQGVPTLE